MPGAKSPANKQARGGGTVTVPMMVTFPAASRRDESAILERMALSEGEPIVGFVSINGQKTKIALIAK